MVQKPHTNLPDTLVDFTSAPKCFQMFPDPHGANQSALKLCKRILKCSWKHLQLWRCVQDAIRFDWYNNEVLQLLRPLPRCAGDFERSWDLWAALHNTWCRIVTAVVLEVRWPHGISSIIFIFVTVTRFAASYYGMSYLSKSLSIYTYNQSSCKWYSSIIGETVRDTNCENLEMHFQAIVVGRYVSHHHCRHSVWQG